MKRIVAFLLVILMFSLLTVNSFALDFQDFDSPFSDLLSSTLEDSDMEWCDTSLTRSTLALSLLLDAGLEEESLNSFSAGLYGNGYVCKSDAVYAVVLENDDNDAYLVITYLPGKAASYVVVEDRTFSDLKDFVQDAMESETFDDYWKLKKSDTEEATELLSDLLSKMKD